jgi:hypothetical protein
LSSYRGPGLRDGLRILKAVKDTTGVPILSDIHEPAQAEPAATVLDILQIPAFLCRQTDLLLAAGRTGRVVNIKKAQFLSPWEMRNALDKVLSTGNEKVLLTERGTSSLRIGRRFPPCRGGRWVAHRHGRDHAVQRPGGLGDRSGDAAPFPSRAPPPRSASTPCSAWSRRSRVAKSDGPRAAARCRACCHRSAIDDRAGPLMPRDIARKVLDLGREPFLISSPSLRRLRPGSRSSMGARGASS